MYSESNKTSGSDKTKPLLLKVLIIVQIIFLISLTNSFISIDFSLPELKIS